MTDMDRIRSLSERRLADRTPELFPPLPPGRPQGRFFGAGIEPRVADMLRDPIVHLVMQRDRVSAGEVLSLFQGT